MAGVNKPVVTVRSLMEQDFDVVDSLLTRHFGSGQVVSRGRLHRCAQLSGFVALADGRIAGLLHYEVRNADLEVVTLISELEGEGIGRLLLTRVISHAREMKTVSRCWLVTTNNNHNAINFYGHVGWQLKTTHAGGVSEARKLKPEIPMVDDRGIPIEDELEFEYLL